MLKLSAPSDIIKHCTTTNTFCRAGMDVSPNRVLDFGTNCPSAAQSVKRYVQHNLDVIRSVPARQLLVLDITAGDGWPQLCAFLGVDPPEDVPFPRLRRD